MACWQFHLKYISAFKNIKRFNLSIMWNICVPCLQLTFNPIIVSFPPNRNGPELAPHHTAESGSRHIRGPLHRGLYATCFAAVRCQCVCHNDAHAPNRQRSAAAAHPEQRRVSSHHGRSQYRSELSGIPSAAASGSRTARRSSDFRMHL